MPAAVRHRPNALSRVRCLAGVGGRQVGRSMLHASFEAMAKTVSLPPFVLSDQGTVPSHSRAPGRASGRSNPRSRSRLKALPQGGGRGLSAGACIQTPRRRQEPAGAHVGTPGAGEALGRARKALRGGRRPPGASPHAETAIKPSGSAVGAARTMEVRCPPGCPKGNTLDGKGSGTPAGQEADDDDHGGHRGTLPGCPPSLSLRFCR